MEQGIVSIAVCDDEMLLCLDIEKRIHNILLQKGINHVSKPFFSGKELIRSKEKFDIILLDIKMDNVNGIEAAKKLRENNCDAILIFITSAPEYVYNAFDVEAFHYLLKPVDNTKLSQVLSRAVSKVLPIKDEAIIVNLNRQTIKLPLSEILYFEITKRVIKAHFMDHIYEFYETLSSLEEKLQNEKFFRCHKSFLLNLSYVQSFSKNEIIVDNGDKIPLSKRRYEEFSKEFLSFMKKEGGIL